MPTSAMACPSVASWHVLAPWSLTPWVSTSPVACAGLQPGSYLAFLSHSGSRGTGAQVVDHYTKIARGMHPQLTVKGCGDLANLGWLPLFSGPGEEY